MIQVLIDTGPLVANLNRKDRWHSWAVEQMSSLEQPLVTCKPVITNVYPPGWYILLYLSPLFQFNGMQILFLLMQLYYKNDGASRHLFWDVPIEKKICNTILVACWETRKFTQKGLLIQLPRVTYRQLTACIVTQATDTESPNHNYRKVKC